MLRRQAMHEKSKSNRWMRCWICMPQNHVEGQNTKGPVDPAIVGTSEWDNSLNEAHLRPSWSAACEGRARTRRALQRVAEKERLVREGRVRCDATAKGDRGLNENAGRVKKALVRFTRAVFQQHSRKLLQGWQCALCGPGTRNVEQMQNDDSKADWRRN
jgi:hypothetical protein